MSFRVEGDLILFNGMIVARFEPSVWASLRYEVEVELETRVDLTEHNEKLEAEYDEGYNEGFKDGRQGR